MKTRYLQLSSGHFENELHHGADSEASRAGRVDLVPNGVAVHLDDTQQKPASFGAEFRRDNGGFTEKGKPRKVTNEKTGVVLSGCSKQEGLALSLF